MLRYDYHESILFWVISTSHAIQRVLNEELVPLGMTFRQAEVLAWLAMEGEALSQAELARRMQVAAPTLGGIIDRMERDGWVQRGDCPKDRRKTLLRPTERVQPIWENVLGVGQRLRARATAGLSPEQVEHVLKALELVQENLRNPSNDPGDAT